MQHIQPPYYRGLGDMQHIHLSYQGGWETCSTDTSSLPWWERHAAQTAPVPGCVRHAAQTAPVPWWVCEGHNDAQTATRVWVRKRRTSAHRPSPTSLRLKSPFVYPIVHPFEHKRRSNSARKDTPTVTHLRTWAGITSPTHGNLPNRATRVCTAHLSSACVCSRDINHELGGVMDPGAGSLSSVEGLYVLPTMLGGMVGRSPPRPAPPTVFTVGQPFRRCQIPHFLPVLTES